MALVFLGLGVGLFSSPRPKVDSQIIANENDEFVNNPEEATRKWLAHYHIPDRLPTPDGRPFDYRWCEGSSFDKLRGVVGIVGVRGDMFGRIESNRILVASEDADRIATDSHARPWNQP